VHLKPLDTSTESINRFDSLLMVLLSIEYKIDSQERKLRVTIYRKNRYWGGRYNTIRYIDIETISRYYFDLLKHRYTKQLIAKAVGSYAELENFRSDISPFPSPKHYRGKEAKILIRRICVSVYLFTFFIVMSCLLRFLCTSCTILVLMIICVAVVSNCSNIFVLSVDDYCRLFI